jgi:hypothetical protein
VDCLKEWVKLSEIKLRMSLSGNCQDKHLIECDAVQFGIQVLTCRLLFGSERNGKDMNTCSCLLAVSTMLLSLTLFNDDLPSGCD